MSKKLLTGLGFAFKTWGGKIKKKTVVKRTHGVKLGNREEEIKGEINYS